MTLADSIQRLRDAGGSKTVLEALEAYLLAPCTWDRNTPELPDAFVYAEHARAAIHALVEALLAAQQELRLLQSFLGSINYVDATPDDGYPRRILESYIDEDYWSDNTAGEDSTNPLVVAMNKWREQRNVILRAALDALATPPVTCGECADHKHQCCENTESGLWMARVTDDFWCKCGRRA